MNQNTIRWGSRALIIKRDTRKPLMKKNMS
jgi:hypothetical protein